MLKFKHALTGAGRLLTLALIPILANPVPGQAAPTVQPLPNRAQRLDAARDRRAEPHIHGARRQDACH
jgi:hypothetical protein